MAAVALYVPSRPQLPAEVLDSGFRIYQRTLRRLIPYGVLLMIAGQLPNIYDLATGRPLHLFGGGDAVWWACYGCGLLLGALIGSALVLRQNALAGGGRGNLRGELKTALARLPHLVLLLALWLALLALGLLPFLDGTAARLIALMLLPAEIYLALVFAVALPLVLLRALGPLAALAMSVRLLRGRWWRTLLIAAVGLIVIVGFYALVAGAATVAFSLAGMADVAVVTAVSATAAMVMGSVSVPFASAMLVAVVGELWAGYEVRAAPAPPAIAAGR
jgi:hypothetical protein